MSLPVFLTAGYVSIYGSGSSTSSTQNIVPPDTGFLFGAIDQLWVNNGERTVGSSVMFKNTDIVGVFVYNGQSYTIIPEAKIIFTESADLP